MDNSAAGEMVRLQGRIRLLRAALEKITMQPSYTGIEHREVARAALVADSSPASGGTAK